MPRSGEDAPTHIGSVTASPLPVSRIPYLTLPRADPDPMNLILKLYGRMTCNRQVAISVGRGLVLKDRRT